VKTPEIFCYEERLRRNREADIKMDRTEIGRKWELEQGKGHVPCRSSMLVVLNFRVILLETWSF